jgi:anaerobic carbon-monoxide dehydrogenase iron sulfur subunit
VNKSSSVYIQRHRCTGCHLCGLICPHNSTEIFQIEGARIRVAGGDQEGFTPQICRNCQEAPCLEACPAGAIVRRKEDDHVVLLKEKCITCNMCIMVCPFNAIRIGTKSNDLCNTCEGLEKCAVVCEHGAIGFMDLNRFSRSRRRKAMNRMKQEQGETP